jgi:UrcA family protein
MKTLAKTLIHALAAAGLAGAAMSPAFAKTDAPRTAEVSYNDLDLATAAGQRTLDKRIEKAVREVCRSTGLRTGTRIMDDNAHDCLARARAEARQQVALLTSDTQRGG